jgi:hypothetical protein
VPGNYTDVNSNPNLIANAALKAWWTYTSGTNGNPTPAVLGAYVNGGNQKTLFTNGFFYDAAQNKVPIYLCPSSNAYQNAGQGPNKGAIMLASDGADNYGAWGIGLFLENSAYGWGSLAAQGFPNTLDTIGRTNYTGVGGYNPDCVSAPGDPHVKYPASWAGPSVPNAAFQGVFHNRSQVPLAQVTSQDGTANTLMFGETKGDWGVWGPPTTNALSWMCGMIVCDQGVNHPASGYWGFDSGHTGGITNFCRCDGSVVSVNPVTSNLSFINWANACGWQDGQNVVWSTFSN